MQPSQLSDENLPQDKDEADYAESLLARELANLSAKARDQILFDIHGIRQTNNIEDDRATVTDKLQEMQDELMVLKKDKKAAAYERAWNLGRAFVENENFCLLFLRATGFDPSKAAQRLALHFEVKQELFVRDSSDDAILVRNVTWDDLDGDDRGVAESGFFQIGSRRDVAGRPVVFVTPTLYQLHWKSENVARAKWYILMSLLISDSDMQKQGIVSVSMGFGASFPQHSCMRVLMRVRSSLPLITAAMHNCYHNSAFHIIAVGLRVLLYAVNAEQAFRVRFHNGTLEQVAFELQTFGIPMEGSPWWHRLNDKNFLLGETGGVSVAWHLDWLRSIQEFEKKKRKESESTGGHQMLEAGETTCMIPRRFDVLFGRSPRNREHPGTLRCYHLVRMHRDVYEKARRRGKTKVADQVIAMVKASTGRFLRYEKDEASSESRARDGLGGSWVVVDDKVARAKVAHMFRRLRQMEKVAPHNQTIERGDEGCDEDDSSDSGNEITNGDAMPPLSEDEDEDRVATKKKGSGYMCDLDSSYDRRMKHQRLSV